MGKATRILWTLVALLSVVAGLLSVALLRTDDLRRARPVLMPMYTFEQVASDPKTQSLGIAVEAPPGGMSGEGWGVQMMDSLARTAYLGPTLGPEEIALGIALLNGEPDLAPSPEQADRLAQKVRVVADAAAEIDRMTREIAGLMGDIECGAAELVAGLPPDVRSEFPDAYACPEDAMTGADLWRSLADRPEGGDR